MIAMAGVIIELDGKTYVGIQAFADAYNLTYDTVRKRRERGWSWEKIASVPLSKRITNDKRSLIIEYRGVVYKSYAALVRDFDIPYTAFVNRLRRGETVEAAVTTLLSWREQQGIDYDGNHYTSVTALAKQLGLSERIFRDQLDCYDSVQDAVSETQRIMGIHVARSIRNRDDIACAKTQPGGRFILVTCKVCGRKVMLSLEEAKKFVHSDNCERNEWL